MACPAACHLAQLPIHYTGPLATPAPRLQVAAVAVASGGDIYSASLDKTIRQWRDGQCAAVMEGHEAAVLCLLLLPNGDLVSGGGDCTMRVWSGGKLRHTIQAHADTVRCGGVDGVRWGHSACCMGRLMG